jgi:transposase, IS6 family
MKPMSASVANGPIYIDRRFNRRNHRLPFSRPSAMRLRPSIFCKIALWRVGGIPPRVINVDGHAAYPQAIRELKASGELGRRSS